MAIASGSNTGPNELQWKLVGIQAANSITASVAILTPVGMGHMDKIIPLLLTCLSLDDNGAGLLMLNSQITTAESRRENRRMSIQINTAIPKDLTTEQQLLYTSMQALRHFFETTSIGLIRGATANITSFILANNSPPVWSTTLLETVTSCAPVQVRFSVLVELVDQLTSILVSNIPHQMVVTRLISSLLSASVNMIGLSVIDILRSLLHSQLSILRSADSNSIKPGTATFQLINALKDCTAALASHVYYAAQISDMISEILARCEYRGKMLGIGSGSVTPMGYVSHRRDQEGLLGNNLKSESSSINVIFLVNSLETIYSILSVSAVRVGGVEKSELSISCWDGTQSLLNHDNLSVRVAYGRALVLFFESDNSALDKSIKISSDFIVTQGSVGYILTELFKLATNPSARPEDYLITYRIVFSLVRNMGDHGIIRSTAFAFALEQESKTILSGETSQEYTVEQGLALGSISYALLYQVGAKIDSEVLLAPVREEIKLRKALNVWYTPIDILVSLRDQLKSKHNIDIDQSPLDQSNAPGVHPIDHSLVTSVFSTRIPDFETTMSDILEVDFSFNQLIIPHFSISPSVQQSDSFHQVNRARSLKQLNQRLKVSNPIRLPTGELYLSTNNNTNISLMGSSGVVNNTGDEQETENREDFSNKGEPSVHLITDIRRDFSPRVKDLKKAASGYNIRGAATAPYAETAATNNEYAPSIQSNSSGFANSNSDSVSYAGDQQTQQQPVSPTTTATVSTPSSNGVQAPSRNPAQNDTLDVMSFLSSLSISNDRGRLV